MKRIACFLYLGIAALTTTAASAYELATHGMMTQNAYQQSQLTKDPDLLKNLGLDPTNANPFGEIYYDVSGTAANERRQNDFEKSKMPNKGQDFLTIWGWLLRGAIREDDVLEPDNGQPVEDPYNTGNVLLDNRVLNHFYDPIHDWPLTVGVTLGKKAPDWASGTNDVFNQPNTPESGRRNHFTVFDARETMYRALTGKSKDNQDVAQTKDDRNKYWATLFRALGDIVHLVEDMAQPQHTRNDPHAGKKYDGNPGVRGHKSLYEAYIETRAAAKEFELPSGDKFIPPQLNYTGYDTPRFTDYLSYFTTRHKHPDPNQITVRQGLADYSNRGFFSAGKNLNPFDAQYDYPSNNAPSYGRQTVQTNWLGQPFGGTMTLFIGSVPDSFTGQTDTGVPLTAVGAWDQFLEQKNLFSISRYTLVRDNYDAMADRLIPRAVAYSAGFIDYFFRGRIEAEDAHYADTGIKLKIKNAIDPEKYAEWQNEILYAKNSSDAPSTLRIAYEYQDEDNITQYGTSDAVDLNTSNGDDDVAPGKVSREVYAFPMTVPSGKIRNLKYRLVFRGRLGDEDDAVVTAAFKPVSGFLVNPSYLPQDEIPGARMIYKTAMGWKLALDEGLVAGNIDWKGWYEGNPVKPTKVLSWMGPTSRYFGVPFRGGSITNDPNNQSEENLFAPEIYHNGEIFSVAPKPVLGSALIKDASDKVWIVAVCKDGFADVIYRRPYKKSSSAAIYNPDTAKDGWREIGRSMPGPGDREPGTPWFFKGDGTEAQTMRKWVDPNDQNERVQFKRLIVNIDINAPSASVSPKTNDPVGFVGNIQCSADYDADGAGTGTLTSLESGSYVIAVDYDNMTEVLATVDENSSGNTTTTVTVTKDANGNVTSTKTNTTLSGNQTASLTQSPGGSPITLLQSSVTDIDGVTSDTYKNAEITYYLDLRKKLYVYYQQEWNQAEQKVSDTTVSGAGDYAEHMYVLPEQPPDLFSNAYTYSYTSQITPPEGVFSCDSSYPATTRYEPNFGWVDNLDIGGGGWAVDVNGNVLVSQKFYSDTGYEVHDAFNYLKDGDINAVLGITAGAPAYYPVGVLH